VLLPGNGPKGKPLVRYRQSDLRTWADQHARKPSVIRRRKAS
jgi:hypothetical protein